MRAERLEPSFVEEIPRELEPGVLYVSMEFSTALHLCACGCQREVVTPLHPTRWSLRYDGEAVSLHPSVGSWALPCRSHYFIRDNQVRWAASWSDEKVRAAQALDRADTEAHFDHPATGSTRERQHAHLLARLWRRLTSRPT